jgi:Tfp pilus assembly protein PilF
MMDFRWQTLALWATAAAVGGCGAPAAKEAENHLIAATTAMQSGDKATAISELTASIDESPNTWAYFQRARLYVMQGQNEEAAADCQKGLELDPHDRDLNWLAGELKKPPAQRFKGRFARSPSAMR